MPLLSPVERTSPRGRLTLLGIYVVLALGAASMVYPFLLMLGMSVTNSADNQTFRAWPAYLTRDEALYRKYLSERYDQDIENYNELHATAYAGFQDIPWRAPDAADLNRAADAERFIETRIRAANIQMARAFYRKYPLRTTRAYNKWLVARFGGLDAINARYRETQAYPGQFQPPYDAPLYRLPKVKDDPKEGDWAIFKQTLPASWLCLPSSHSRFRKFLKERYADVAALNAAWESRHLRFEDIALPWMCPDQARQAGDWQTFVAELWPQHLVAEDGSLLTAERLWTQYLGDRYPDLAGLRTAHGEAYDAVDSAPIPYASVDRVDFERDKARWRRDFITGNYAWVLEFLFLRGRAGVNTILLVAGVVLLQLIVNPLCAYALSRFRMPYTGAILMFCLATMSFPAEVAMIPNFVLLKNLGLLNTLWALILPTAANGFFIFLLKGFFDSLSDELFEAAAIDGAGPLRCFWSIALPLCRPVLAVIALQAFVFAYGSFMWAYMVCQDSRYWTLMVYIHQLQVGNPVHLIMAALVLASLPTLLVFLVCQKVILQGIVVPTEK